MRSNKKGFTIVELVIVIAVIAILAAVLIPTISGLVKKANLSADQVAVRNMNTALATSEIKNFDAAIDALSKAGFNADNTLIPVSKGYSFYWYETYGIVVLVDAENKVVYPDNKDAIANFATDVVKSDDAQVLFDLKKGYSYTEVATSDAATFLAAVENGQSVTLTDDITIPHAIRIDADEEVVINLGGNEITADYNDGTNTKHTYAFEISGSLTIKNGTVNARGIRLMDDDAELVIEDGVTVNALDSDGGYCVFANAGGNVTINGGTFNALNGDTYNDFNNEPGAVWFNGAGTLTINGGTFNVKSGAYAIASSATETVIKDATINGWRGAISIIKGSATISNVTATAEYESASTYYAIACGNAEITIESGKYTSNGPNGAIDFSSECTESGEIVISAGVVIGDVVSDGETKTKTNN